MNNSTTEKAMPDVARQLMQTVNSANQQWAGGPLNDNSLQQVV